ncbi:hypothetical protein Csa_012973 [Cucumis sativus]|nr:hypothetical protein Csa_012973 [Cucumis sativus]
MYSSFFFTIVLSFESICYVEGENYVEGEEVSNRATVESKQKEVLKVIVTEVLDGDKFYVQTIPDQTATSLQQQLETLNLQEVPLICGFSPKKGDIVLAQFSSDN